MSLQNTPNKFGDLTKVLHWVIAALFVIQYYLVYRREYFPNDTNEKLQYLLLHKSLGLSVLVLAFAMLAWRRVGIRPSMPSSMSPLELTLARYMHIALYAAMLIMPISGILMSLFGGYPVSFFGLFELPKFDNKNETLGSLFYITHVWSSYAIIPLVAGHTTAALYHHYVKKDDVLKRML